MSELTGVEAALYGGLGGGLIGGVFALLGVVVERVLRLLGRLHFEAAGWEATYLREEAGWGLGIAEDAKDATEVEYRVAIDLYNGREVPTSLRNVRVEMILDDGGTSESRADDLATGRDHLAPSDRTTRKVYDKLAALNIPPRQVVHKELRGSFGKEAMEAYRDGKWQRIDFVADRPKRPFLGILGSKTYRKAIKSRTG